MPVQSDIFRNSNSLNPMQHSSTYCQARNSYHWHDAVRTLAPNVQTASFNMQSMVDPVVADVTVPIQIQTYVSFAHHTGHISDAIMFDVGQRF